MVFIAAYWWLWLLILVGCVAYTITILNQVRRLNMSSALRCETLALSEWSSMAKWLGELCLAGFGVLGSLGLLIIAIGSSVLLIIAIVVKLIGFAKS